MWVDTVTGLGTVIGNYGFSEAFAGAFNPFGAFYTIVNSYGNQSRLASVNLNTGAATAFGAPTGVFDMMIMEFSDSGTLYTASWATDAIYTMNTATGVATLVGSLGFRNVMDFAFDSAGTLWATNQSGLYRVNASTGAGTFVADMTGPDDCNMGIAFDENDQLFGTSWCAANSPLWRINTTTGAATLIGLTGVRSLHGGDSLSRFPTDDVESPRNGSLCHGACSASRLSPQSLGQDQTHFDTFCTRVAAARFRRCRGAGVRTALTLQNMNMSGGHDANPAPSEPARQSHSADGAFSGPF